MSKTLFIIFSTSTVLMGGALWVSLASLNSTRTERDTAVERSNNQGEQVRLCRVELGNNFKMLTDSVEAQNKAVEAAAEIAKSHRVQSDRYYQEAARWSKPSTVLVPDGTCETRLENMNKYMDRFYAENYSAR